LHFGSSNIEYFILTIMDNIFIRKYGNQISRIWREKRRKTESEKIDFIHLKLYLIVVRKYNYIFF